MDIKIDNQLTENTKEKKPNQPNSTFCNQDTRGKKKSFLFLYWLTFELELMHL